MNASRADSRLNWKLTLAALGVMLVMAAPSSQQSPLLEAFSSWAILDRTWMQVTVIALATFISEDLACIATGLAIRNGTIDWSVGLAGCLAGIYVGDLLLFFAGKLIGRGVLRWTWLQRQIDSPRVRQIGSRLDQDVAKAIFASRFIPGTRLPLYLAAGALNCSPARFSFWAAVAVLVWTPLILLPVALLSDNLLRQFQRIVGDHRAALLLVMATFYLLVHVGLHLVNDERRLLLWARISRLWRWEFWPSWVFYAPIAPLIACLGIRRGVMSFTAVNPAIPHGGVVGESKYDILRKLPPKWIIPSARLNPGESLDDLLVTQGWNYPLILKPDAGQRGAGVRMICHRADAAAYLRSHPLPVLVQTYHPGPLEAGIFYYRIPGESRGRIFSITDKVFPVVAGDGRSTLRELIWRHPRFRMQAGTFFTRHADDLDRILNGGERFSLTVAGNHCQGTMFQDGEHLFTPALERRIDEIAQHCDGFYFGRFDVRYADIEELRRGEGFAVVEFNGVSSESTNIYDPSRSLLWAYRTLYRQWELATRIGALNRARGAQVSAIGQLWEEVKRFYTTRDQDLLAG